MIKFAHPLVLFLMMFAISSLVNAQVYKWQDVDGHWRYSDIPPMNVKEVKRLTAINGERPKSAVRGADVKKANTYLSATGNKEPLLKEQAKITVTEQANQEIKQQNCQAVKTHLAVLETGGRIKALNANGELAFLSDAELAQEKINAQSNFKQYCE